MDGPSPIRFVACPHCEAQAASLSTVPGGLPWPLNTFSLTQISLSQGSVFSHDD